MFKTLAPLAALAVLATGCTIAQSVDANRAKEEMVGMSRIELLACAGLPGNVYSEGDTEIMVYYTQGGVVGTGSTIGGAQSSGTYGMGRYNSTAYGGNFGASNSKVQDCQTTFVLRHGRIDRVNMVGRGEGVAVPNSQCEPIIRNCIE